MIQAYMEITGEGTNGIGRIDVSDEERQRLAKEVSFSHFHQFINSPSITSVLSAERLLT